MMNWRKITLGGQPMRWKVQHQHNGDTAVFLRDRHVPGQPRKNVNMSFLIPSNRCAGYDDWDRDGPDNIVLPSDVAALWAEKTGNPVPKRPSYPARRNPMMVALRERVAKRVKAFEEVLNRLGEEALDARAKARYAVIMKKGEAERVLFKVEHGDLAKTFAAEWPCLHYEVGRGHPIARALVQEVHEFSMSVRGHDRMNFVAVEDKGSEITT